MRTRTLILTLLSLAVTNMASGTVRYASPKGIDPEGLSMDKPGRFGAMVDSLVAGDTLFLTSGQYDFTKTVVI